MAGRQLPQFQSDDTAFQLMQSKWASVLDPVLGQPQLQGNLLKGITLNVGQTAVDHKLNRLPQGWIICDLDGAAQIYRSAAFNTRTLLLTSDAQVTVTIWVF